MFWKKNSTCLFGLVCIAWAASIDAADNEPASRQVEFEDPFADFSPEPAEPSSPSIAPEETGPSEEPRGERSRPSPRPVEDPFGSEPFRRPLQEPASPRLPDPLPELQIEEPSLERLETDEEFIRRTQPQTRGPRSADFDRARKFSDVAPVGTWNLGFSAGPGFNLNRRPNQLEFQMEGGYRIWKTLDLNGLLYFRGRGDRILGFQVLPTWTFPKLFGSIERFDLRTGLGMGWSLRGIRGSDFQIGYLSVRGRAGLYYYLLKNISFHVSLDLDSFIFRMDTGGQNSKFELTESGGPPLQWIPHFGVKFEF